MLYNTSKSVIDAISKIVNEDRKKYNEERDSFESKLQLEAMKKMKYEYIVPEDIEKEGVAHFMGAAAAAHKAGQKKFNFGGKVYPVRIKPHIAHQVNSESVNSKADQIDEISKKTLGSYISKASVDMANRSAEGERKRTMAGADFAHNISRGMDYKKAEAGMMKDREAAKPDVKKSVQRMHGIDRAVGRLTKEEVEELDEYTGLQKLARKFIPGQGQKQAGERAKDQKYSAGLDRAALKYHPDDKKLATSMKSSEKAQKRYERISRGEAPFKSSPNDTRIKKEEVEEIEELSKSTLASYAKKATRDARITMATGKDFERIATKSRKPAYKAAAAATWERKYKDDARRREAGVEKAIDRLAKEELEIEEAKDTPGQSHQCALHVKSEQFGEGKTLFSQHAEPDENGNIEWYDVMFEHGIEKQVPTSELEILISEAHMNHSKRKMKEEVDIDEGRGRPRKAGSPMMKKSEDEDEYGPDTGPEPDQNIVNHLKKSVDTGGTHDVKFADGSSHKVPSQVAHKVLGAMGKLKPSDRLEIQKHIHASHKNLMDVHRMIK